MSKLLLLVLLAAAASAAELDLLKVNGFVIDWSNPYIRIPINTTVTMERNHTRCWNQTLVWLTGQDAKQQRIWGPFEWGFFDIELDNATCNVAIFRPFLLPKEPETFVMQVGVDQHLRFKFDRADESAAEGAGAWLLLSLIVVLFMVGLILWACLDETKMAPYSRLPQCELPPQRR